MNGRAKKDNKQSKGAQKLKDILATKHAETQAYKQEIKTSQPKPKQKKKRHPPSSMTHKKLAARKSDLKIK